MAKNQKTELETAEDVLWNTNRNVFLTGAPGTGKTTLLKRFMEERPNGIVCAPTGVAAVNAGGDTMHRVFSIPIPCMGVTTRKVTDSQLKPLASCDYVIVDEISFARADAFSFAIKVLKKAEKLKGGKIRLIVVGDFFQLPPVVPKADAKLLKKFGFDESGFSFTTPEWKSMSFKVVELTEIKRQKEDEFVRHLSMAREANPECLGYFNRFVCAQIPPGTTVVCGTNAEADRINREYIDSIEGNLVAYQAEKKGRNTQGIVEDVVLLKEGCMVMFTVNDQKSRFQNGTFGTVSVLDKNEVYVKTDSCTIVVGKHEHKAYSYKVSGGVLVKKETGSVKQIPLKVAAAITIHKSQGKTFDQAAISPDIFAPGQLYVALSRVRDTKGLFLTGEIDEASLISDPLVQEFCHNGWIWNRAAPKTKPVKKKKSDSASGKKKGCADSCAKKEKLPKSKQKSTKKFTSRNGKRKADGKKQTAITSSKEKAEQKTGAAMRDVNCKKEGRLSFPSGH